MDISVEPCQDMQEDNQVLPIQPIDIDSLPDNLPFTLNQGLPVQHIDVDSKGAPGSKKKTRGRFFC